MNRETGGEGYVGLHRNETGLLEIESFGATEDEAMKKVQTRGAGTCSVHPCTARLYACRETLDIMRITDDALVPTGSIPVRVDADTGVADLAFYRRAVVCGSRVIAVGTSPAELHASLRELYRVAQREPVTESFFRCVLLRNAAVIRCSAKLYREAADASHGPGCASLQLDTVGEYRAGMLVSPDEYEASTWAYAADFGADTLEVWEVGKSYNNLLHRCMALGVQLDPWSPPIPPDCDGVCEIHRCTPELYEQVCASPWYLDRGERRIPCMFGIEGRYERC